MPGRIKKNRLHSFVHPSGNLDFVSPAVIDADYNILVGHGRIEAARAEGYENVPCVFAENLTEAQKRAYILADNQLALNAGWDEEMLSVELSDLQDSAFDLHFVALVPMNWRNSSRWRCG